MLLDLLTRAFMSELNHGNPIRCLCRLQELVLAALIALIGSGGFGFSGFGGFGGFGGCDGFGEFGVVVVLVVVMVVVVSFCCRCYGHFSEVIFSNTSRFFFGNHNTGC